MGIFGFHLVGMNERNKISRRSVATHFLDRPGSAALTGVPVSTPMSMPPCRRFVPYMG